MKSATVPCPFCDTLNRVDLSRVGDRPKCGDCGKPILLDRPLRISDGTMERVIAGSRVPVLVDFHADWCGPCKMIAPMLDDIAGERAGDLLITKLDTDRNPAMAARHAIRGLPALILFGDGKEVARQLGVASRRKLDEWLAEGLQRASGSSAASR